MILDIIIMTTRKNLEMLKIMLPFVRQNIINGGNIYVVSQQCIKDEIDALSDCFYVDEDNVYPGLTYRQVASLMEEICGNSSKTGWYFQQFLKLAWAFKCKTKNYIVIDADTIPLAPLCFIDSSGKFVFTKKIEYNKPYFDTIEELFNNKVSRVVDFSFVSEHMIFSVDHVKEMLALINDNEGLIGSSFYEKILRATGKAHLLVSGFSEFETYGNFMMSFYPQECNTHSYRTQREAVYVLGSKPTKAQLEWASQSYDIISIEVANYGPTLFTLFSSMSLVRNILSMRTLCKLRFRLRRLYRRLLKKPDFVLEENI